MHMLFTKKNNDKPVVASTSSSTPTFVVNPFYFDPNVSAQSNLVTCLKKIDTFSSLPTLPIIITDDQGSTPDSCQLIENAKSKNLLVDKTAETIEDCLNNKLFPILISSDSSTLLSIKKLLSSKQHSRTGLLWLGGPTADINNKSSNPFASKIRTELFKKSSDSSEKELRTDQAIFFGLESKVDINDPNAMASVDPESQYYEINEVRTFGLEYIYDRVIGKILADYQDGIWLHISCDRIAELYSDQSKGYLNFDELHKIIQTILSSKHLIGLSIADYPVDNPRASAGLVGLSALIDATLSKPIEHRNTIVKKVSKKVVIKADKNPKSKIDDKKDPKDITNKTKHNFGLSAFRLQPAKTAMLLVTIVCFYVLIDLGIIFPNIPLPIRFFEKKTQIQSNTNTKLTTPVFPTGNTTKP
jgi:arginase family enzyme